MIRPDTNDVLPSLGEEIERYRVIAEVAHGGMAAVYIVHRKTAGFDKLFAMKVMLPHLRSDQQFTTMFLDEAQIGSKIQHPNVVQIFDVGERLGSPFMVMELLRGKSLSHIFKARAKGRVFLSRGLVFWILARVADGLHAAHTAASHDGQPLNIIHRDVSFQNIHVGYDGQIKVVDFGIADAEGRESRTRTGEVLGKMQFMAPEQFHRKFPVDRRVDLWALGVVAWRALSGKRLFRGKTDAETMWNVVNAEVPDISQVSQDHLPPTVVQMVMSCLRHNPNERPQTAARFAEVFHEAAIAEHGSTEELALFMENAFSDSKRNEEAALTQAIKNPQRGSENAVLRTMHAMMTPADGSQSVATPETVEVSKQAKGSSKKVAMVLAGLSALAVAAIIIVLQSSGDQERAETAESPVKASASLGTDSQGEDSSGALPSDRDTDEAKAPSDVKTEQVTIRLGENVRMALVDGTRHDERPLVIALSDAGEAHVTVLTDEGERAWTIGAKDDGRLLEVLDEAPAVATKDVVPAQKKPAALVKTPVKKATPVKKKKKKKPSGELIEVPL